MIGLVIGLAALVIALQSAVFFYLWRLNFAHLDAERLRWEDERAALLDRIQAPELAANPAYVPEGDDLRYVGPDDDEAFAALQMERTSD